MDGRLLYTTQHESEDCTAGETRPFTSSVSAIPGDPRWKAPMYQWQFCGQWLHPQWHRHRNTGCKYRTDGAIVDHTFILPVIQSLEYRMLVQDRWCYCGPHLYLTSHTVIGIQDVSTGQMMLLWTTPLSYQSYSHWNTGCKYRTDGAIVDHTCILPVIQSLEYRM